MRFSDIKEVYAIIKENCIFSTWSMKEQVNDFIIYMESQEDIKKEWSRASGQPFPYCLEELFFEYMAHETYEEEEEREPLKFIDENKYLNDWYYKNVI